MSKILIIGCGGVAQVAIQKCAMCAETFTEICIASRTKSKCDAFKEKLLSLGGYTVEGAGEEIDLTDETV